MRLAGAIVTPMIVYERNLWEPVETYYFRSSNGLNPICELSLKGDSWEVLFYHGATHPGPHPYESFDHAKAHIMRYLAPREALLCGEKAVWAGVNANDTAISNIQTRHPRRARRRSSL